jgi:hypothetical protein
MRKSEIFDCRPNCEATFPLTEYRNLLGGFFDSLNVEISRAGFASAGVSVGLFTAISQTLPLLISLVSKCERVWTV